MALLINNKAKSAFFYKYHDASQSQVPYNPLNKHKPTTRLPEENTLKNFCLILVQILFSSITQASAIDVPGTAFLLRDGKNAAIVITDAAARKISAGSRVESDAPLYCGDGYCAIGQFDRRGRFSLLGGQFNRAQFSSLVAAKKNPRNLSERGWIEQFSGKAFAYPDQCQDKDGKLSESTKVDIGGISAEQLYNFLRVEEKTGKRASGSEKLSAGDFIRCEKILQYDPADVNENGVPTGSPSFTEYRCELDVTKDGQLAKISECRIYGATISAGGGQ